MRHAMVFVVVLGCAASEASTEAGVLDVSPAATGTEDVTEPDAGPDVLDVAGVPDVEPLEIEAPDVPDVQPEDVSDIPTDPGPCVPACDGKECGPDGCEGECGTCPEVAPVCGETGLCGFAPAPPDCIQTCDGKECGEDLACGKPCGKCPGVAPHCGPGGKCQVEPCETFCKTKVYPDGSSLERDCGDDSCGGYCGDAPCADDEVCGKTKVCGWACDHTYTHCSDDKTQRVVCDGIARLVIQCPAGTHCEGESKTSTLGANCIP